MSSKTLIAIIVVTVASTLLGTKILTLETHKGQHEEVHSENEEVHDGGKEPHKGPHGGWLFGTDFQLELKIFETGSPPRFRAFGYHRKRTIPPEDLRVEVDLSRLGEPRETFLFRVLDDYLVADAIVREPHSFEMQIRAFHEKELYQWEHSQVEGRVELTPESAKYAGVDIEVADARVMNIHLKLPGEIHFNEDRLTHVVPRIEGVVSKVLKRQGERVEKGDVL
ncbi:efflux transporter periplasmic adaptor subunit, partial [bacterium]|nr:efflux transporter periplasmic adaptor subunit [bacterium]